MLNGNNSTSQIESTLIVVIPYLLQVFNQTESLGAMISDCQRYGISISRVVLIKANPEDLIKNIVPRTETALATDTITASTAVSTPSGTAGLQKSDKYVALETLPNNFIFNKIEMKNICVKLGDFTKIYHCTFMRGKLNCLVGLSGGGKTTLINSLLGLVEHTSGNIIINDEFLINNLFFENDKISISFQGENFFDRSIEENIMYPENDLNEKAKRLIKLFNIEPLLNRENSSEENFKASLSGGEKKRLSIIRCIAKDAQIYILDEPTNELDEENVKKTISELKILKENSMLIVISHDKRIVEIADNIIQL